MKLGRHMELGRRNNELDFGIDQDRHPDPGIFFKDQWRILFPSIVLKKVNIETGTICNALYLISRLQRAKNGKL